MCIGVSLPKISVPINRCEEKSQPPNFTTVERESKRMTRRRMRKRAEKAARQNQKKRRMRDKTSGTGRRSRWTTKRKKRK